jgi:phosphoribosylamine---glycine ligase
MNILITGSGGREHALAWKIKQSSKLNKLFVAPGNAGTAQFAKNLPIDVSDFENLAHACIENHIDMVLVGPEAPLVEGITDFFNSSPILQHIAVVGPDAAGARLEGSKAFAKTFMHKYQIPTAGSFTVTSETLLLGIDFLKQLKAPYVLKADGLAAGKGVLIINDINEAEMELKSMLNGKFGTASAQVVIEEFLDGIELSAFVITDGKDYKLLPSAKDYKRIGEGDTGPNTGGMGAVSPVVFADRSFMEKVESKVIVPTIKGLRNEGIVFKGFIFFGLMNVKGEPYVIEYNVRLGDPETECILPRISSDFVDLLEGVAHENLGTKKITIDDRYAVTVVLVSGGYPSDYKKHFPIRGFAETKNCIVFHAGTGTDVENETIKTAGGRVIAITSIDYSFEEARKKAFENAGKIQFEGKYFRGDIGLDLLKYKII